MEKNMLIWYVEMKTLFPLQIWLITGILRKVAPSASKTSFKGSLVELYMIEHQAGLLEIHPLKNVG